MYSAINDRVHRHIDDLRREAERIWETEHENQSVQNLAAAQFMCMSYLGRGRDHATLQYLAEASAMGVGLGLFGADDKTTYKMFSGLSTTEQVAYSWTAWGCYNCIVYVRWS